MILVPFLVVFLLTGWGGEANRWICLAIFVAASVTDWFDGHLARKYNLITNFGKFMDPLADKLLVCSAMICMIEVDKLPAWVVIIIIGREFIISGFRLIAAENGIVIAANYWGKFKTVSQMIMIILQILDFLCYLTLTDPANLYHLGHNDLRLVFLQIWDHVLLEHGLQLIGRSRKKDCGFSFFLKDQSRSRHQYFRDGSGRTGRRNKGNSGWYCIYGLLL